MHYDILGRYRAGRGFAMAAALSLSITSFSQFGYAQEDEDVEDDIFELSPFEVDGSENEGYRGTNTLAGSRLNTQLKDVASAISVVTKEFFEDTAVTKIEELLVYTVNTEVAGQGGNFFGESAGDSGAANRLLSEPHKSTRIRGLASADLTRDFFLTDIPLDSYAIDGVDIQRGPNAILFGLGSPAGIINYSLKKAMLSEDAYSVSARVNDQGSMRFEFDGNKVLIPDVLGFRLVGVTEDNEFEQKYKYENTDRVFASLRWTPKMGPDSMMTEFLANYEYGEIDASRPRVLPPEDFLSTWWTGWNKVTRDQVNGNGLPNVPELKTIRDHFVQGGPTGTWWDEPGLVFPNSDGTETGGAGITDIIRQRGGSNWGGWIGPGHYFQAASWGTHPAASKSYYSNPDVLAAIDGYEAAEGRAFNGMPGWHTPQITDRSIFDYRKYSVEGPNSRQFTDFDTVSLTFRQTYLNNRIGIEAIYNDQDYTNGYENLIGGTQKVSIDVNRYLRNGQPNPNLGRPYVVDNSDSNITNRTRENTRFMGFAKFDFADVFDSDGVFAKSLGSHTFTAVASKQDFERFGFNYDLYGVDLRYPDANRRLKAIHYLNMAAGPNALGANSAQGLGISGITVVQRPGEEDLTAMVQGRTVAGQPENSWPDWTVFNVGATTDRELLYSGYSGGKDTTKSDSFVWQGSLLNDTVKGIVGYSKNTYQQNNKPSAQPIPGPGNYYNPYDPEWVYPDEPQIDVSGINRTYGVVVHASRYMEGILPKGFGFSLGYNQSENFQPSQAGRTYWGEEIAPPSGTTKDYTLMISAFDDKVSLRATKYESTIKDATYNGTRPDNWSMKNLIARSMNGMMAETWTQGKITVGPQPTTGEYAGLTPEQWAANPASWTGRQNTTPEHIVNKWMFGEGGYDAAVAATPLPAGWTVANHPELLTQPLRIRALASTITEGTIRPGSTEAYTQPPISPAEADYRAAWFAARSDEQWARPFGMEFFQSMEFQKTTNSNWGFWDGNVPNNLKTTSSLFSEGHEFELTVNPSENWRIMLNASQQEAVLTDIMPGVDSVFEALSTLMSDGYDPNGRALNYWARDGFADIDFWGDNNTQRLQDLNGEYRKYLIGKQGEGRAVNELKEWRYALVTNYSFGDGKFKGLSVGGSMRWEDDGIIGFVPMYNADLKVWVSDLDKPFYSKSRTNYDFWAGYKRRVFNDTTDWSIQLNVRDLFASDDLIPIAANPDGTNAQFRIPAQTSFMLTNSFKF